MKILRDALRQIRRNPLLFIGIIIILAVILFGPVMSLFVDVDKAKVGSGLPDQRPSAEYPLG